MRIKALTIGGIALTGALLATAATAAPPAADGREHTAAPVVVRDIQIPVPGQPAVRAYLVRPDGHARPRSLAGVLYLHWLEPGVLNQNRTEFLAEAVRVAGQGAVAVLPDLVFPWNGNVVGTAQDADSVRAQLAAVTGAYRALLGQPGVDPARTAVVGHDYGAMFGALLTRREPGIRAEVFMAGDATWSNWFAKFFLGTPDTPAYDAVFAGLDPVDNVGRTGSRLYLQWAGDDFFIPAPVHDRFAAADPAAKVSVYAGDDHSLDDQQVQDDRLSWLSSMIF
jgi:dienelactone hydrolase